MRTVELTATIRQERGKNANRRLRKSGLVPAVVYGHNEEPLSVAIDARKLNEAVRSGALVANLTCDGEQQLAIIKGVQRDPIRHFVLSADFQRVGLHERIRVTVPVITKGEPEGCSMGGILEQPVRELDIECPVSDIPEQIEIDVSSLGVDDALHVSDISVGEGTRILNPEEEVIAMVSVPRVVEAEVPEEGAEEEGAEAGEEGAETAESSDEESSGEGD